MKTIDWNYANLLHGYVTGSESGMADKTTHFDSSESILSFMRQ